jgi:hypothetical protein
VRRSLLLFLLIAAPVAAQPSAGAVLDAWRAGWDRASARVSSVTARERSEWTVDGPRGRTVVEGEGLVRFDSEPPERSIDRVRVDGQMVDPERGPGQGRRWQRAFGPAGREVHTPPGLPDRVLARVRPTSIAPDRVDGVAAWRVAFDSPADRAEAWFTRSASPRLIAMRVEGSRPRGGRIVREIRYVRVGGLDVPAQSRTTFSSRQRRRLREYLVTLTAVGTYSDHTIR